MGIEKLISGTKEAEIKTTLGRDFTTGVFTKEQLDACIDALRKKEKRGKEMITDIVKLISDMKEQKGDNNGQ